MVSLTMVDLLELGAKWGLAGAELEEGVAQGFGLEQEGTVVADVVDDDPH